MLPISVSLKADDPGLFDDDNFSNKPAPEAGDAPPVGDTPPVGDVPPIDEEAMDDDADPNSADKPAGEAPSTDGSDAGPAPAPAEPKTPDATDGDAGFGDDFEGFDDDDFTPPVKKAPSTTDEEGADIDEARQRSMRVVTAPLNLDGHLTLQPATPVRTVLTSKSQSRQPTRWISVPRRRSLLR